MSNNKNKVNTSKTNHNKNDKNTSYKNDGIFNFTIHDYVLLSYVLQYVDENINRDKQDENNELYFLHTKQWKKYAKQYEQIYQQHEKNNPSLIIPNTSNLQDVTKAIRNYFSHYIHITDFIKVIFSSYFIEFCEYLQKEALYTFNARFPELTQNEDIFKEIDKRIASYFVDTKYTGSKFFLFICSIIPKSKAHYLLSNLYYFKKSNTISEEIKNQIDIFIKLLTVLSIPDSYNSQNTEQDLIISYSVINYFSQRYIAFDGTDKERKKLLQSHNTTFIIRSLVDIIEVNKILGDIEFARNGEYYQNPNAKKLKERLQPSFEEKDKNHELYIKQHSVVIRYYNKNIEYRGILGINVLLFIVLFWIKTNEAPNNNLISKIKLGITKCVDACNANNIANLPDDFKLIVPQQILEKNEKKELSQAKLKKAITDKLTSWNLYYFSQSATSHNKICFIADWFNQHLEKKLNQTQYQELIYYLTAKNISFKNIQEFLNPYILKLDSSFFNQNSIDSLLAKIKLNLSKEFEKAKTKGKTELIHFAQKIKLRNAKNTKTYPHKEQYLKYYLSRHVSPNLKFFQKKLGKIVNEILTSNASFSKKYIDTIIFSKENGSIFNQFYKIKNGAILNTKSFNIYCQEVIVYGAVLKMLQKRLPDRNREILFGKDITNSIKIIYHIKSTDYKVEIFSHHLGRHNLHLDQERMAAIIENYWDKPNIKQIPYHKTEEQKKTNKLSCYNDLENEMEKERRILLQAFLQFEKELAIKLNITEKNINSSYITLRELLENKNNQPSYDKKTVDEIVEYRNKAYHSYPKKRFSKVHKEIQPIYNQIKQEKDDQRKSIKKIKQKIALSKKNIDK